MVVLLAKVLVYSHFFFPSQGGVEKTTYLLARYLAESGHSTTVVTQVAAAEPESWPFKVVRKPRLGELLREVRNAEIIHLQGFVLLPFLLAKVMGRPVVWAHHGYDLTCPKQIGWKDGKDTSFRFSQCVECLLRDHDASMTIGLILLLGAKRLFRRFADAHVAPSRYVLTREGIDGVVIPNSVDTELYIPGPESRPKSRILFVGRLIEEKGVSVLLDALELLILKNDAYHLEIIGTGHKLGELRGLVTMKGIENHVSFSESVREEDLVEKIRNATLVAAPTLNAEPFGIVGLEALSCATPFVGTTRGGFPEFADGIATLVPPGDARALAEAIEKVELEHESGRRTLAGRQRVTGNYDYRLVGAAYVQLYARLLHTHGKVELV